jgi:hypothetical protein
MMCKHAPSVLLSAIIVTTGACAVERSSLERERTEMAKTVIVEELLRQAASAHYQFAIDPAEVEYIEVNSEILPSLTYIWGRYTAAEVTHSRVSALAGVRNGQATVIHDLADWQRFASGLSFLPDAVDVVLACTEIVMIAGGFSPWSPPIPWTGHADALADAGLFRDEQRLLESTLTPPSLNRRESTITGAEIWFITPTLTRLATKFTCLFPRSGSPAGVEIAVIDSVGRLSKDVPD